MRTTGVVGIMLLAACGGHAATPDAGFDGALDARGTDAPSSPPAACPTSGTGALTPEPGSSCFVLTPEETGAAASGENATVPSYALTAASATAPRGELVVFFNGSGGHPSGAIAVLHSGWRGTAAHIVECGIALLASRGYKPRDLRLHTGPAICGNCYEVSADVYAQLTGANPGVPTPIDLRALIADHAYAAGVRQITASSSCTRCDNDRFYSYRAGDDGRQLAVMIADA